MISEADNQAALGLAAYYAAEGLGLLDVPPSAWTQSERIAYIQTLAREILSQPAAFTAQSVSTANYVLGQSGAALELQNYVTESPDGSAALTKIFVDEFGDQVLSAGADVANLGRGALNLIRRAGNVASNVGESAEKVSGTIAFGWVASVAVIAIVGLLVVQSSREIRGAVRL